MMNPARTCCPRRARLGCSIVFLLACATLAACGGDETVDAIPSADASADVHTGDADGDDDADAAAPDVADDTGTTEDATSDTDAGGTPDVDEDADAGGGADIADTSDTSDADDDGGGGGRVLDDWLPCSSDADCPVGFGACIETVPLNRAATDGTTSVAVSTLSPALASAGVCTRVCTNSASECDGLVLEDARGTPTPYTCKLVYVGDSPYPDPAPPFPFDDALDADAMAAGRAFGALCVPPFQLSRQHSPEWCSACSSTAECGGDDVCWSFATGAEAAGGDAGTCLEPCDADGACMLGFSCTELSVDTGDGPTVLGAFCAPIEQTCTDCRDLDGDGRGPGRCGASGAVSAVDCDDLDPGAYYDARRPDHAFPDTCGVWDFNCNGLSDAAEQVGAEVYPEEHCTACFDTCSGAVPNGAMVCAGQLVDGVVTDACITLCDDPEAWADCNPDIAGCETPVDDPTRVYYFDADGDGRGDPDNATFACSAGEVPDGFVSNSADCNDGDDTAYGASDEQPAAAEVCDGVDNDCNGTADDGIAEVGEACATGLDGACSTGTWSCGGESGLVCDPDVLPGERAETCNGEDDDCDGVIDNEDAIAGVGDTCVVDGVEGVCAIGEQVCSGAEGVTCEQTVFPSSDVPDDAFIDSNCDGIDGDIDSAIFLYIGGRDIDSGGIDDPVATFGRAIELAEAQGRDIYAAAETHNLSETLTIREGVSVYGGYSATTWSRSAARTVIELRAEPDAPGGAIIAVDAEFTPGDGTIVFDSLDISTLEPTTSSTDVIGMRCSGCSSVSFRNVRFVAGDGTSGAASEPGLPGVSGGDGTSGRLGVRGTAGTSSECGRDGGRGGDPGNQGLSWTHPNADGGPGDDGDDATSGGAGGAGGDANGFAHSPADDGRNGAQGEAGAAGSGGLTGSIGPDGTWVTPAATAGEAGGHGGGGGGGGGGPAFGLTAEFTYVNPGAGGAGGGGGGCGGEGGAAGARGGSSIALLLHDSNGAQFENVTANAGNGGNGASGGNGSAGGNGGQGAETFWPSDVDYQDGRGGHGGGGAGGSGGGGGAGGSSIAVARDATTFVPMGITLEIGRAGTGGAAGAGATGGLRGASDSERAGTGLDGTEGEDGVAEGILSPE